MIPAEAVLGTTPKVGVPEAVEVIRVRHASGGHSELQLKSYDTGVESFYGTARISFGWTKNVRWQFTQKLW